MKTPTPQDADKCFRLRKLSKEGMTLEPEQLRFVEKMNNLYPEWYASLDEEVFNSTVPFGSNVKWSDTHKKS
jgi:hypothetical protein